MKLGVPAMDPYPIKFIYNVSQIMLCSYMTLEALLLAYRNGYTVLPCVGYNKRDPALANLLWLFYVSKIWDFWDTIFIVIGKKWRQLSFLHCYHHITIFLFYWLNAHVNYDGDIYLTIVLNGFIHTGTLRPPISISISCVHQTLLGDLLFLTRISDFDSSSSSTSFIVFHGTQSCTRTISFACSKCASSWWWHVSHNTCNH